MQQFLRNVIETERQKTLALREDSRVVEAAMNVAYYTAMLAAAEFDPLSDEDDQSDILEYLESKLYEEAEHYATLISELL